MLYREIITVCSQIHTQHINKLCVRNLEIFNIRPLVQLGCKELNLCYRNQLHNAV
jgi:hypothetical protein